MVTSVGLTAPAACAAMRAHIDRFSETHFMIGGEWLIGSSVRLVQPWRGREKLIQFAKRAITECLAFIGDTPTSEIPLLVCVAEQERPGRLPGLDASLITDIQDRLDMRFGEESAVISNGRVGGVEAVQRAGELIDQGCPSCMVVGIDTYLVAETVTAYASTRRLLLGDNSDGFIPGEAGAAVVLGPAGPDQEQGLRCLGLGFGTEQATVESDEPLRADGLVEAVRSALSNAGMTMADIDYRIADISGEQYGFKEASLVVLRLLRQRKEELDIWHPGDSIGEVGAAIVPCVLGLACAAARKQHAPGRTVLCHFANDAGERGAVVLTCRNGSAP